MKAYEPVFTLLKSALWGDDLPGEAAWDWEEVYQELREQTVSGLPAELVLSGYELPGDLSARWEQAYLRQTGFYYRLLSAQSELAHLLHVHGIPAVILKGTAAARYYPRPSARAMGDVDLLVPEERYLDAYRLMQEHGYALMHEVDYEDHHIAMKKSGIVYEVHRRPVGLPPGEAGAYLMDIIRRGMERAEWVDQEGWQWPCLPPEVNGLVLLLHMAEHMTEGIGLRQIIDWMLYADRVLGDDRWAGQLQPVLERAGFEAFAGTVTRMCQIFLGLREDGVTWCRDADACLCRELMAYVMRQGNFGRKVTEEDRGVKVAGALHGPVSLFRLLQKRGVQKWEPARKYPFLRPFAWLYTCRRYAGRICSRKNPLRALASDLHGGMERQEFLKRLGIPAGLNQSQPGGEKSR